VYFRLEESGRSLNPESVMLIRRGGLGLRSTFDRLADEVQLAGTYTDQQRRALLASLLVQFWRLENESAKTGEAFHPLTVDQQSRLVRLTRRRILEGISPAELAESVGLSGDYFSRRFRETFGISPRVWLNRQRIEASRRLLEETDLTINQVADRLGYAGAAQFSRQFSKVLGVSPGAYRSSV
jgi:AraC-like DNA-binding protein